MSIHQRTRGFSLIELLTTISISTILFTIAVPNFQKTIERNEADNSIFRLYRLLQSARSHAINQQQTITVCGSDDGQTCLKIWHGRLLIFNDKNNDKAASAEEIIRSEQFNLDKSHIKTRLGFGKTSVKINTIGQPNFTGSFIYCPPLSTQQYTRRLTWNRIGRLYFGRDTNNDGIIEDTNGKAINCS